MRSVWEVALLLCLQCVLHSSWVAVVCSTMQQVCFTTKQPRHPLKGRFFGGFFINSDEHFATRLAPSVYGCRAACEQTEPCLVLSFNASSQGANNCKLYNSTRFHWKLERDNSSIVILLTPPGCDSTSVVHGGWSAWSMTSDCSFYGKDLLEMQERSCDSPSPACNGRLCDGPASRGVTCNATTGTVFLRDKPCSQLGQLRSHDCSKAIDGILLSDFASGSCTHTSKSLHPWWQVDLGMPYTILNVTILNRSDCCGNRLDDFSILVGNSTQLQTTTTHACQSNVTFAAPTLRSFACGQPSRGRFLTVQRFISTPEPLTICEIIIVVTL